MGLADTLRQSVLNFLAAGDPGSYTPAQRQTLERFVRLHDYSRGQQARQLRVKPLQADDNITINLLGLVIERSISMMFGDGISFDLPGEGETTADEFIQSVWAANRQVILLHRLGQLGGTYGTAYIKILRQPQPSADGRPPFRLVPLQPWTMRIETDPHDMDQVTCYVQEYVLGEGDRAVAHRYRTERVLATALTEGGQLYQVDEIAFWQETHFVNSRATGGHWEQAGEVEIWDWPFAPIAHCQNLVDADSPYGQSDIADLLDLQDRYNLVESNTSKIIRYHAHPKTWGRGSLAAGKSVSWGPDEIVWLAGEHDQLQNLEMQSDLASSRLFALDLRQALFDIARTVDTQSLADKLGALTNFGLRVLYMDALNKNHTKRELYGELLLEINRRMLVVAGFPEAEQAPGTITWPDPLPVNQAEQAQAMQAELDAKVASRQTWQSALGYDPETEDARIKADTLASANIGGELLKAFTNGNGGGQPL